MLKEETLYNPLTLRLVLQIHIINFMFYTIVHGSYSNNIICALNYSLLSFTVQIVS